jgi:hypothetical protein
LLLLFFAFTGDESSLLECKFNPWREHDCSAKEHAGVVCRDHPEIIHIGGNPGFFRIITQYFTAELGKINFVSVRTL